MSHITALHRNLCDAAQELTRAHAAALHEHGRDYDPARRGAPTDGAHLPRVSRLPGGALVPARALSRRP